MEGAGPEEAACPWREHPAGKEPARPPDALAPWQVVETADGLPGGGFDGRGRAERGEPFPHGALEPADEMEGHLRSPLGGHQGKEFHPLANRPAWGGRGGGGGAVEMGGKDAKSLQRLSLAAGDGQSKRPGSGLLAPGFRFGQAPVIGHIAPDALAMALKTMNGDEGGMQLGPWQVPGGCRLWTGGSQKGLAKGRCRHLKVHRPPGGMAKD